ncbi:MAG TPA: triose-phosphate isomerase [Spongiibacteraceae bacterium]|nr:triose-phosphate isomerase [Spongiibacteraceae bacterium]
MRRKLVIGNWKMHGDHAALAQLLGTLRRSLSALSNTDVAVCPPFVYLAAARQQLADSVIALGAQNLCAEAKGAFTGEISAAMLHDCGCHYAIVGHSERRQLFNENDALVAAKTAAALQANVTPIVCVGETLQQRETNATLTVIGAQLAAIFERLDSADISRIVIAYEPVWAIGTGKTATPLQAQEVHAFIRRQLATVLPDAATVPILYGGSVKADNAATLFAQPDIDGGLVGGASLNAEEFTAICKAAE